MATRETRGANGKIDLKYKFYESASGHVEEGNEVKIKAKDCNTIQLIEEDWYKEMFKNSRNESNKEVFEISVDDLINLIKQNGIKVK